VTLPTSPAKIGNSFDVVAGEEYSLSMTLNSGGNKPAVGWIPPAEPGQCGPKKNPGANACGVRWDINPLINYATANSTDITGVTAGADQANIECWGDPIENDATQDYDFNDWAMIFGYVGVAAGRPYYCSNVAGETTVNKPILNVGETLTVSSKSNTPVNGFFYAVYNADNNPSGNSPTVVCSGTGTHAQCPNGGTPMILSDPNNKTDGTGLRTSGSASVAYANLFVTDKTTGKQVTNIQINAYFNLNGGQWSYPEVKCVTFTKMGAAACVPVWTPDPGTICLGTQFEQTSNCPDAGVKLSTGTKNCGCTEDWHPAFEGTLECAATCITQTKCGETRNVCGTKPVTWSPNPALTCVGTNVTQTSNCGGTRVVPGTKSCAVGACMSINVYKKIGEVWGTNPLTPSQLQSLKVGDVVKATMTTNAAGTGGQFGIKINGVFKGWMNGTTNGTLISSIEIPIPAVGTYEIAGRVSTTSQ